jgi:arsenate reductase-like glutaredoxin family protein
MALAYGNQFLGGGYTSMFGKTITTNTVYGKLGEHEILVGLDAVSGSGGSINNKELNDLYDKVGVYLEELMVKHIEGNLDDLVKILTKDKVDDIKYRIYNSLETVGNKTSIETLIKTYQNILNVLEDSTEQYKTYQITLEQLETAQEKASILEDPEKLQEYINTFINSQNSYLMELPDITTTSATVKPEYQEYIKLYGVPDNLEFDEDKLYQIKKKIYR